MLAESAVVLWAVVDVLMHLEACAMVLLVVCDAWTGTWRNVSRGCWWLLGYAYCATGQPLGGLVFCVVSGCVAAAFVAEYRRQRRCCHA